MPARSVMTMRCTIQRNEGGLDPYGGQGPDDWEPVASEVPCFCFYGTGKLEATPEVTTPIGTLTILLPLSTDIEATDRIGDVTDRLGTVLFAGPLEIVGPVGHRRDHKAIGLREV